MSSGSLARLKQVGGDVYEGFNKHNLMNMAAALAYYTALSLAPLLLVTLVIVAFLGQSTQDALVQQIESLVGNQAAEAIRIIIERADDRPRLGSIAGLFSLLTLIFSASVIFAQLQASFNVIFEATSVAKTNGIWAWIRKRILSMGMVIVLAFMAMVSLAVSAVLQAVFPTEGMAWKLVSTVATFVVFAALFTLLFHFLPDRRLDWRKSAIGGVVTAVLFAVGKYLIGLYLGQSAVGSSYGAAGSLIVLLLWVYYSSLIVFVGAEITRSLTMKQSDSPQIQSQAA